jgi:hypothetical protein
MTLVRLSALLNMDLTSIFLVPIYDARGQDFDPNKDLNDLSRLPLWKNGVEDVPRQSLAVVGYTIHTYKRSGKELNLSTNVQWLVVLGTCDD